VGGAEAERTVVLLPRPLDHPDAVALTAEVQDEYVQRYGAPDEGSIQVDEFVPPRGVFVIGYVQGRAVAMGGWRTHDRPDLAAAEIKRMYVRAEARGRGYGRAVLAYLEDSAVAAGQNRLLLETGLGQPEAIALYRNAGYSDVAPFGHYARSPLAVHLAKVLR
jgi:GNAT superfamily N-acetyltransferase